MLRNQRAAAEAEGLSSEWTDAIDREISATESDPERVPWSESLPESTRRSLEPFRSCIEASYSPETNPFELSRTERSGRMSYRAD